ncbi:MAG: long-chain-fatty-acid--CoA ligase [Acidimicrobiales bacterium]|nr:long-chain-fatty-acid--CoA ligase [Acidimicrobiales bacterium]
MKIDSVVDIIRGHTAERPDAPMVTLDGTTKTWAEVTTRAGQVAHALQANGVGSQDRIAYIDKNAIEYFELLFGGAMINAVLVAVNWRLAGAEMRYIVNDSEATVLVVHDSFAPQLAEMIELGLDSNPHIVVIGDAGEHQSYEDWVGSGDSADPGFEPASSDVCLQLYTSGTTGLPKGAQLTNGNFAALLETAASWDMDSSSVNLAAMPLFHIGGSGWALFGMSMGAHTVLLRELDPGAALDLIETNKISHAFLVPAYLQFLQLMPWQEKDLSSMELVAYGASPITEEVLVGAMEMFKCDFVQVYGLTETTGAVTQLMPEDHDPGGPKAHLLRSAGSPLPGVTLKIVDTDTGNTVPDGEVGEVWIHSPANMLGYWKLPEATAEALPGDGWFRSGDAGYLEDGFLFIHDRVKDMIVSGGENIYPAEVENALMAHDAVADCAVIGVPHDKWGETPKALVVLAEGASADADELISFCKGRLAGFKCPTSVDYITDIPRNPSGKILKKDLRAPFWEGRDRKV